VPGQSTVLSFLSRSGPLIRVGPNPHRIEPCRAQIKPKQRASCQPHGPRDHLYNRHNSERHRAQASDVLSYHYQPVYGPISMEMLHARDENNNGNCRIFGIVFDFLSIFQHKRKWLRLLTIRNRFR
jgi:hypothetical protein